MELERKKSYAVNAVMPLKLRVPEINVGFTIIKDAVAYNSYLLDKKRHFTVQNSISNKLCFQNSYQSW